MAVQDRRIAAVVVAGGSGTRFGSASKVFTAVGGRPLVEWSLTMFDSHPEIAELVLVAGEHTMAPARKLIDSHSWSKPVKLTRGGNRRQDSIQSGIQSTSGLTTHVMLHDGARPLVSPELISRCIRGSFMFESVITAVPVVDTIKSVSPENRIVQTVDRQNLRASQTPQLFPKQKLLTAIEEASKRNLEYTDEAQLFEFLGYDVGVVEGDSKNLKVTLPADIALVESLLEHSSRFPL